MPRLLRAASALTALAVLAGLAACAPADDEDAGAAAGISVSVYQPRPDIAAGRIAIQVHNDSDEEVTVQAAELTSSFFTDDLVWPHERDSHVKAGQAVDLRVQLGDGDCAEPNPAEHSVTLTFVRGDAEPTTAEFAITDTYGVLPLLHDDACLGQRVAAVAALTASTVDAPPPGQPATLTITVEPTGEPGEVVVHSANSTTLLMPLGPGGVGTTELDLGITVDADGPAEFTVPLVPNRCDAHALAEDKVGTRIPLQVTAPDGTTGRLVLTASDSLRAEMYAFYSSFCGLG